MKQQIKVVLLKEIKETLKDNKFIMSMMLNIIIFSVMGFGIDYFVGKSEIFIASLCIIMYPPLSMWILSFPFIQEKFWNEKLLHGFQPLLTLPITLKTIWLGKLIAIFLITYPSTALIAIILSIIYYLCIGINPFFTLPLTMWILVFILIPLTIMIYNSLASWMALRFNSPRIIDFLQYTAIGIFIFLFIGANKIVDIITALHFTDWALIIGGLIILVTVMGIIFYLVNNLKKENIIN